MPEKILVGPLLGIESNTLYTVCVLMRQGVGAVTVKIGDVSVDAVVVGSVVSGDLWRAELDTAPGQKGKAVEYSVLVEGETASDSHTRDRWTFYVPGKDEDPRIAYTSCNGFSSRDLMARTEEPYCLWDRLAESHFEQNDENLPFSLLIMGGDQLYADDVWDRVPALEEWSTLNRKKRTKRKATLGMIRQLDRFYDEIYRSRWSHKSMSLMLASVPSVMMWDDHDIFDGWGSYPEEIQSCNVYQAIYESARKHFELFQIRSRQNKSLLDSGASHCAFGFSFRGYYVLGLDNRSQRTRSQIMAADQWAKVIDFLENATESQDLIVMSAVPVVYRDFSLTESAFDVTPWEEELTDDLKDHWRANEHQGERARLIMRLLDSSRRRMKDHSTRTIILSGDVHLGCLGVINDRRSDALHQVHQVVSSGIVHPPPSRIQWLGIMAVTNDRTEYLNETGTVEIRILCPFGSPKYIRSRNYVTLQKGSDQKLWISWECESDDKPEYPLV